MPEAGPAEHELLRQSIRDFLTNMSAETEVRRQERRDAAQNADVPPPAVRAPVAARVMTGR